MKILSTDSPTRIITRIYQKKTEIITETTHLQEEISEQDLLPGYAVMIA